jgi:hypothetical protein
MPGLGQILRLLTGGDPQTALDFIPATFERTSRDVAFMNLVASPTKVKTILYSFTNQPEEIHMRLWNLKVMAEHRVRIGVDSDDDDEMDEVISTSDYKHLHRGDTIDFTIPPRKAIVVEITQTKEGHEAPKCVVDLALAPEDIEYKDGRLSITVHNIGTLDCEGFEFTVWQGEPGSGELLRTFSIGGLEAPHDLKPRRVSKSLDWNLPHNATLEEPVTITVEVDTTDVHYEITERNNVIARSFPHETKAYMKPRMWPTIAEQYGRKRGDPFPQDSPAAQVR